MFMPGQILTELYQLQQQLGRTAAGHQTWLAVDLQSQEQVTVKLLAFSPQMHWEELKLFEREAQVLQALNHPRIPSYRDYFDIDKEIGGGVPWFGLVQDYIRGSSLQELLEQGRRFPEKQVRSIATEVLEILIYLHELSPPVLHRDIKPSNLILGEDEHIYLVDFGAVQAQAAVTGVTFTVVGTSGYAPLEQFWGRAVPASDLYALGATLIHLLTGTAPADLPQKDSRIQFAERVSLKPDLISWIEKVTETAIEKRFGTARKALEALKSRRIRRAAVSKVPALNRLARPSKTYIKLNQSEEKLEINIPPAGLRQPIYLFDNIGCWWAILLIFLPIGLVLLPFIAIARVTILCGEGTSICFDRNKFELMRTIFGITYGRKNGYNRNIVGVFLHNKGRTNQVSLRTRDAVYFLGGALREDECAWLAQEIQDWLNR